VTDTTHTVLTEEQRKAIEQDYVLDSRPFLRFDPDGRIRSHGVQAIGYIRDEQKENPFVIEGDAGFDSQSGVYRNHVVPDGEGWVIAPRPAAPSFDRTTMKVGEGASIPDLTPCRVSWTGPISGSEQHIGGDYELGWLVPGTYQVRFDPFPALPTVVTFVIEE
jgi:hypothetical protein